MFLEGAGEQRIHLLSTMVFEEREARCSILVARRRKRPCCWCPNVLKRGERKDMESFMSAFLETQVLVCSEVVRTVGWKGLYMR
jgi:hypothetical protein